MVYNRTITDTPETAAIVVDYLKKEFEGCEVSE
jgi:hypothetical protein